MRAASRLAMALLVLAACGKTGGGDRSGSANATAAPAPGTAIAKADIPRDLALPTLAGGLQADNVPTGPMVAVTAKSIIVDGRAMVVVENGKVDPAELEGGAAGLRLPRIAAWARTWSELPGAGEAEAMLLAIDPGLPSAVALQVLTSLVPSKQRRFGFVVRTADGVGAVPLELPGVSAAAPPPSTTPPPNPEDLPLGMVVTLMPDRVVVWSMSRLEGTLAHPKLALTPASDGAWLARLREDLTDIRRRRWDSKTRPDDQQAITVMVDASVASGDLVNVIAAVRKDAKGEVLFPDVRLASGEEAAAMVAAATPPEPEPKAQLEADAKRIADSLAVLSEDDVTRYADLLTAEGSGNGVSGDISKRMPGADLSMQLDAVREGGAQVAVGGGGARGTRGDGDVRVGMGRGPTIDGPGAGSADVLKTPSGRITIAAKTAMEDTSLTADLALMKIQSAYMAGLKRCYKEALKKDPTMRGEASLSFTVNEAGRATGATSSGVSREVDACFEGVMANWRFNVPKDDDGESTEASFRIKLGLTPD